MVNSAAGAGSESALVRLLLAYCFSSGLKSGMRVGSVWGAELELSEVQSDQLLVGSAYSGKSGER